MSRRKAVSLLVVGCAVVVGILIVWSAMAKQAGESLQVQRLTQMSTSGTLKRAGPTSPPEQSLLDSSRLPILSKSKVDQAALLVHVVAVGTGGPVPGIPIDALSKSSSTPGKDTVVAASVDESLAKGETDAAGLVELIVPSGLDVRLCLRSKGDPYSLREEDPPFVYQEVSVGPLAANEHRPIKVEVPFTKDFVFWGRVISAEDGQPVANARVRSLQPLLPDKIGSYLDWEKAQPGDVLETAPDGCFSLHLSMGQMSLSDLVVIAPGFGPTLVRATRAHGTRDNALEIMIGRTAVLRGRVRSSGTNYSGPLSVRLSIPSYGLSRADDSEVKVIGSSDLTWWAACDEAGRCDFQSLPSESYLSVDIMCRGKVVRTLSREDPDPLVLEPGEVKDVEWSLVDAAVVRGLVLGGEGTPIHDHEIWLLREALSGMPGVDPTCSLVPGDADHLAARTTTDGEGRFVFANVERGQWWVGIAPTSVFDQTGNRTEHDGMAVACNIHPSESDVQVTIRMGDWLFIRGEVLSPDGVPIADVRIELGRSINDLLPRARSNSMGEFELGPLVPGAWSLRAASITNYGPSDVIAVKAGEAGVVLQLKPSRPLTGIVLDHDAVEGEQADVILMQQQNGCESVRMKAVVGEPFRFSGVVPGTYVVVARTPGGRVGVAREILVSPNSERADVRIELSRGATLIMRYQGQAGAAEFIVECDGLCIDRDDVEKGVSKTIAVPAGRVLVRQSSEVGLRNVREIAARIGEEVEVVLGD